MTSQGLPVSEEEAYPGLFRRIPGEPEPAFENPAMMVKVWGRNWGLENDVGRLRSVQVSRPGTEWEIMQTGGEFREDAQAWVVKENMWYWNGD
jgi:hypothetical protein